MDENAAYEVMIEACAKLQANLDASDMDEDISSNTVQELLDAVTALDGWLRKGGSLPDKWADPRLPRWAKIQP